MGRRAGDGAVERWDLILWLALGSIAMRGAGCVYNDIVDRDLDRQVARTRSRPLASGAVSLKAAWIWLVALCLIGLVVLLQLHRYAAIVALVSLAPVAAYPFMKRITWWPQAWLGIVFSWGALVGWSEVDRGRSTMPRAAALPRVDLLGDRLRHDLRAAGCRGRCAGRRAVVGARAGRAGAARRRDFLRARARLWAAAFWQLRPTRWCSSRCCPPRCISPGKSRRSRPPTAPTRCIASARTDTPGC